VESEGLPDDASLPADDVAALADVPSMGQDVGIEAIAGFPLLGTSGVVGVMEVAYLSAHIFSADELRVLGLLASQAAAAITNARLYEETRSHLEELTMLHELSLASASSLSLEEIADRVIAVVQQGLGFEQLGLFLLDEKRDILEPAGCGARVAGDAPPLRVGDGLEGWAAEHAAALRVADVAKDGRYSGNMPGVSSVLVVPLMVGDRVIGVISAASSHLDAFSGEEEHLMTIVARQLAVAIENARLYQETELRLAEVSTLYQLAQQANASLDLQERLDSIVWALKESMGCRACSIALLDTLNDVLMIRAAAGIDAKWKDEFRLGLGEGIAGRVALEGKPLYVSNTQEDEGFVFFDTSVRSLLTVPMCIQNKVIGTLSVDSDRADAFSAADERLLVIAAAQVATAIENAQLYASLEQRARTLTEAYAELQEVDRLRDEMVQNISHELRMPLTFVKGYVELLLAGDAGPLTDAQKEHLEIVIEKTNAVTRLVSDIMFLQQADKVTIKKQPVSLVKLALRATRGCAATAEKAGLTVVGNMVDELPSVAGDEGRLLQVFDNLLGNAIKFSPNGGQINVVVEDVGSAIQVSVSDQGVGIPKDQLDRVFDRFYQVDGSARRRFAGIGLGLTIAKRIVEAHGGKIWAESGDGRGSTFRFTIPKYTGEGVHKTEASDHLDSRAKVFV
jgi:signal transduction histidine kinase